MDAKKRIIILIAGGSSSGKSAICDRFKLELDEKKVIILEMDGFYEDPPEGILGEDHDWDHPDAFNRPLLRKKLADLQSGKPTWLPGHDYKNYCQIEKFIYVDKPEANIIIVNGLFPLYYAEIREMADYKFFIDCDSDVALIRRTTRDASDRGYSVETTMKRYSEQVKPAYHTYIEPTKKYADLCIPNHSNLGVEKNISVTILVEFLKTLLRF
jgi:uridine kinase